MAVSEANKRAQKKYDAANTVQLKLKLNKGTDADILAQLDASGNKQGYIKKLIREDIKRLYKDIKRLYKDIKIE